jgi:dTDP-4-dehydrorhamnose reductase
LAADFIRKITNGEGCNAFVDLRMSPTSLIYAISAIQKVATGDQLGIFHLSGESELTYAEFAKLLAKHMGADESVVRSCKSSDYGVKLLYQPARPALGMTRTCQTLKIAPEPMEHLLNYLTGKRSQL